MSRELVDSGIEWIGKIPKCWKSCKVKNVFYYHKDIVGDRYDLYNRVSLTMNGVVLRDKNDSNGLQPENFNGYQIVNNQDIIFKLIDLENVNTSRVGRTNYMGITSPAYILLHEKNKTFRYNEFYFMNLYYQEVFNNIGGNGVRSAINKEDLLNIPLLMPSNKEQEKIANYLDNKVSKIEQTIEDNKKEIELLEEYKINMYDKICLKGLNNNQFKKSNHYSIDKIPEKWDFNKVISVLQMPITDGPHETPKLVEKGIPFISADAVKMVN